MIPEQTRAALRYQRGRRRRIVILVVLGLAVLIAVAVVVLLPKNTKSNAASTTTTGSSDRSSNPTAGDSTTTPKSTTTTDPDAGLPALPQPTASDPLRVLEIGDSLGEDLGFQLSTDLPATGVATVAADAVGDTGLANEGYYDWPEHLEQDIAASHPQIVVIFLGANDGQGFDVNGAPADFGTPAWIAAYTQRVDQLLEESNQAGARVVWVGMPPMQDPGLNSEMQQIDAIFQEQTEKFHGTLYLPSATALAPSGQFTFQLTTSNGDQEVIRTPDGVHLTSPGAELLSQAVIHAIDTRWNLSLKP
jgi:uncharacterized protein